MSNGTLITEKKAKELAQMQEKKHFGLQISIDSNKPEINDSVRGKTKQLLKGIKNLL